MNAIEMPNGSRALHSPFDDLRNIRIPEFVLFATLILWGLAPVNIGFKLDSPILLVLAVLALTRSPRWKLGNYGFFIPCVMVAALYLSVVSVVFFDGTVVADWRTRLVRIMAVLGFVFIAATGRLDLRSGLLGWVAALIINVPLFYLGLAPHPYGELLTGALLDKNVAGYAYAVGLVLVVSLVKNRWMLVTLMAYLGCALWLTGSRTSIAAAGVAIVWIAIAPRLNLIGRGVLLWFLWFLVSLAEEDYSQIGVFSDREGSDLLRARIDAASKLKLEQTGFFGQGLGEAYVLIEEKVWFFHNSWWTLLVEGGWPWAALVVVMTVVISMPIWRSVETRDSRITQGLGLIVLVCALRLGEVFLTTTWGVVMAFALHAQLSGQNLVDPDGGTILPKRPRTIQFNSARLKRRHDAVRAEARDAL